MKLYASLIGPLNGLYYPLPTEDEITARQMLNSSKLKMLWCSVYSKEDTEMYIERYGGSMLPDSFASQLDYDSFAVKE